MKGKSASDVLAQGGVLIRLDYHQSFGRGAARLLVHFSCNGHLVDTGENSSAEITKNYLGYWRAAFSLVHEEFVAGRGNLAYGSCFLNPTNEDLADVTQRNFEGLGWSLGEQVIVAQNHSHRTTLNLTEYEFIIRAEERITDFANSQQKFHRECWKDVRRKLMGFRGEFSRNINQAISSLHSLV